MKKIKLLNLFCLVSISACATQEPQKEELTHHTKPATWYVDSGTQRNFIGTEPLGELVFCTYPYCAPLTPKTPEIFEEPKREVPPPKINQRSDFDSVLIPFKWNSAKIEDKERRKLDAAIEVLHKEKVNEIFIIGAADYIKNKVYNESLANKRAAIIKSYFDKKSVNFKVTISSKALLFGTPQTTEKLNFGRNAEILVRRPNK